LTVSLPAELHRFRVYRGGNEREIGETYQNSRALLIRKPSDADALIGKIPISLSKYDPKTLRAIGIRAHMAGAPPPPRMSAALLKKINDGALTQDDIPKPDVIFMRILTKLNDLFEFPDSTTGTFVALWIMGTYFFPLFQAYPYFYIGGTKRVGKTKMLMFISKTALNAIPSLNLTAAAIFRLVDEMKATLLLDETEDLNDPSRRQDVRSILLGGYKSGERVYRVEGEHKKTVREFDVYAPKAIANINGVEDVLIDRAITVFMLRSLDKKVLEAEVSDDDPEWAEIRDQLYLLMLGRWLELYKINKEFKNPSTTITAREFELWKPIFALAQWVEPTLIHSFLPWADAKTEEKHIVELNDSRDLLLLHALTQHIEKSGSHSVSNIRDWLKMQYAEDEVKEMKWLNTSWVGRALRRLGFQDCQKSAKEGGRHVYSIDSFYLSNLADRMGLNNGNIHDEKTDSVLKPAVTPFFGLTDAQKNPLVANFVHSLQVTDEKKLDRPVSVHFDIHSEKTVDSKVHNPKTISGCHTPEVNG
jgi:hypothetical protein